MIPSTSTIVDEAIETWLSSEYLTLDDPVFVEQGLDFDGYLDEFMAKYDAKIDESIMSDWEADVENFMTQARPIFQQMLEQDIAIHPIGHDYALTRNHHGVGFWDRGYPKEIGEKLTEIAESTQGYLAFVEKTDDDRWIINGERMPM